MTSRNLPEITLAIFMMMAAADIFNWALSRCPKDQILLWQLRWPLFSTTLLLLTVARFQDVYYVVQSMCIPWVATAVLYIAATIAHLKYKGDFYFDKAMLRDMATVASKDFKQLLWF